MFPDTKLQYDLKSRFIGERIVALLKELRSGMKRAASINIAPLCGASITTQLFAWPPTWTRSGFLVIAFLGVLSPSATAQNPVPNSETLKKANARPADSAPPKAEPFDGASIEKMSGQCVTLETEQGVIIVEMLPAKAPETVRSFLNLAATGTLETTTFSRVVPGFVIQGGNLSTSDKWSAQLSSRAQKHLPDEPSDLKHVRGVVSMARSEEANSATTHFFILVGDGPHLDGKFSAFGRVRRGLEVADAINRAPSENEKPQVPVRITRTEVSPCAK